MLILVEGPPVEPPGPPVLHNPDPGHFHQRLQWELQQQHPSHHQHLRLEDHAAPRPDQHADRRLRGSAPPGIRRYFELVHIPRLPLHPRASEVRLPRCSGVPAGRLRHGHQVRECQPRLWSSELGSSLDVSPRSFIDHIHCTLSMLLVSVLAHYFRSIFFRPPIHKRRATQTLMLIFASWQE